MLLKLKMGGAWVLEKSGWIKQEWRRIPGGTIILLMYHRILPKEHVPGWIQSGIYVEAETFHAHVVYIKENFRVVPVQSFFEGTNTREDPKDCRPRCAFTFDDGWKDFAIHAFPLLQKYDLPATVFLPTGYIGTEKWFWTDRIAYLFYERNKFIKGESLGFPVQVGLGRELARIEKECSSAGTLEAVIRFLKGIREEEIDSLIVELCSEWGISHGPSGRAFLSWEEIRGMAESGIAFFGSHTNTHQILTGLNEEEIREELSVSRKRLLKELPNMTGKVIFCYPNGKYNERIARLVEETGYSHAVTTDYGWNNLATDRFRLKRIGLHQDMAKTPAMLSCRMLGYL